MIKINKRKEEKAEDIVKLTPQQIQEEIKKENYKLKYVSLLKSTIFTIMVIVAFCILLATLILPVFEIKGSSMYPTYEDGNIVVAFNTNKLYLNDVIAFYHGNKILVKRIVALSGDWVNIKDGVVYVNGEPEVEQIFKSTVEDLGDIEYPIQVPDNQIFVLSDNRSDLQDSRNSQIGCIKKEDILGKVLFKLWELK